MHILFTTSDKPMARLIRWATGECCSHVAILSNDLIFHSNMRGVNVQELHNFAQENRVMHMVEIPGTWDHWESLARLVETNKRSAYDIGALLFCGLMLFCRKGLGMKWLPKQNLWQSSGMYMCTEFVTEYIDGKADSLITPHQLFVRLTNK